MIAVLTGDVVNSRSLTSGLWLPHLKSLLGHYGAAPERWEIFRGDSFQLELPAADSLEAAIRIKAGMRQIEELDVRIAIGIGEKEYAAARISEANGSAFVHSGECFESMKKQQLQIKTGDSSDEMLNLMFSLALLTMNGWSKTVAGAIRMSLENQGKSQSAVARLLGRSQSSVSEALSRGGYDEISRMIIFFRNKIRSL